VKPVKAYDPGCVHVDVKYLPQMPDEDHRQYRFAAIDRATRWGYVESTGPQSSPSGDENWSQKQPSCSKNASIT